MSPPLVPDEVYAELDEIGEDEVRTRLARRIYGGSREPLVEEWLRRKEQERNDSSEREQIAIAREAAAAARDSADAARDSAAEAKEANRFAKQANTIAKIAIAVAAIAAIMSIIGIT